MPVLEAQLLGTPAITTRFGAMADFTVYGVSVPPLQPHSMGLGYAVMPNLTGIIEALHHVAPPSALSKADGKRAALMVRTNMSQPAVAAAFEQLIQLPKPKASIGVVRYGQPPVLRGKWTVVASDTQAVDVTAIAFDTARADTETPPRVAVIFQTTELTGEFTPSAYELSRGNITPQPVVAVRTGVLRAALEQAGGGGKYGELDMAVRSLIQQHHLLADVGGGGAGAGAGELLGGIGAARIYLPPMNPNGGGPVGGPQGRPQGDPRGGGPQQMQGLPQGGSQDDVLKMLAEAQARAAKVSVAADGSVGRV